jgi:hypothetical protein
MRLLEEQAAAHRLDTRGVQQGSNNREPRPDGKKVQLQSQAKSRGGNRANAPPPFARLTIHLERPQ